MSVMTEEKDPFGIPPHSSGSKLDGGKILAGVLHDFSLALIEVAKVGTYGAEKYSRGGWQEVPSPETRYFDAFWRHLLHSRYSEKDPDSGLLHEAQMIWNLLARLELKLRGRNEDLKVSLPKELFENNKKSESKCPENSEQRGIESGVTRPFNPKFIVKYLQDQPWA